jgi:PST family polysaccharide transporter
MVSFWFLDEVKFCHEENQINYFNYDIINWLSRTIFDILQLLNSLFYIIIYPFVIRKLGAENYGTYVFSLSIVTYFVLFLLVWFTFLK